MSGEDGLAGLLGLDDDDDQQWALGKISASKLASVYAATSYRPALDATN